jgi:hypothetical protein
MRRYTTPFHDGQNMTEMHEAGFSPYKEKHQHLQVENRANWTCPPAGVTKSPHREREEEKHRNATSSTIRIFSRCVPCLRVHVRKVFPPAQRGSKTSLDVTCQNLPFSFVFSACACWYIFQYANSQTLDEKQYQTSFTKFYLLQVPKVYRSKEAGLLK